MSTFFLGLGSNQGDRFENLKKAIEALQACGEVKQTSSVYETAPKYESNQPKFLNLVCELDSELAAVELVDAVKVIEQELGRVKTYPNGPRIIDIDLLYSPNESFSDSNLQLPHLRIEERAFVLIPWAEISPTLRLEHLSATVTELSNRLGEDLKSEVIIYKSLS